ncbi:MAG: bacteriochlorophyll c-binding family protein [Chloroflexus sp.]|uniref:bacteriochlorophyll c-binding family protein n=1 Tax=Chloroflexus sp. TaxID=1904827 RepID=UPI00404B9AFA
MATRGWFSESSAQVAQIGDIMFQGHWQWVSNALQATAAAVDNINRNAYPGVSRSGSGEGVFSSSPSNGFRPKRIRSRFNR